MANFEKVLDLGNSWITVRANQDTDRVEILLEARNMLSVTVQIEDVDQVTALGEALISAVLALEPDEEK